MYIYHRTLTVSRAVKLHAFGGISRQGTTLLGLGESRHALPEIFGGIVLPFIDTVGQHSIFHDGCPMHRGRRVRTVAEQNRLALFCVPSAFGPQPMEAVWSLAQEHLHGRRPRTVEQMRQDLAVFWGGLTQDTIDMCIDSFVSRSI